MTIQQILEEPLIISGVKDKGERLDRIRKAMDEVKMYPADDFLQKFPHMLSVGDNTTMSNEARAYASSPESSNYIAADAIIVRDFGHQLAANVFVRHHKPERHIRMFPDRETAMAWLNEQRNILLT